MNDETIKSPIRYWGGKYNHVEQLLEYFPVKNTSGIFVEMFCGSMVVFFNYKPYRAIINDKDGEIVNFWNVIKDNIETFNKELEYLWPCETWFNELRDRKDDVGKAVFFYLKNRLGFSGLNAGSDNKSFHYNYSPHRIVKDFTKWKTIMDRCLSITIWNVDFRKIFDKLEKKGGDSYTFFIYEDPPYIDDNRYNENFSVKDHEDLCDLNHETTHHVILSYGDCVWVREHYKDWNIIELNSFHPFKTRKSKGEFKELLLSNKPLVAKMIMEDGIQQKVI